MQLSDEAHLAISHSAAQAAELRCPPSGRQRRSKCPSSQRRMFRMLHSVCRSWLPRRLLSRSFDSNSSANTNLRSMSRCVQPPSQRNQAQSISNCTFSNVSCRDMVETASWLRGVGIAAPACSRDSAAPSSHRVAVLVPDRARASPDAVYKSAWQRCSTDSSIALRSSCRGMLLPW